MKMISLSSIVNERRKSFELGIKALSQEDLIKYINVTKSFVNEIFNYFENNTYIPCSFSRLES